MCISECAAGGGSMLSTLRLASRISGDTSHVLHSEYQLMPSGSRLRFECSFIPESMRER